MARQRSSCLSHLLLHVLALVVLDGLWISHAQVVSPNENGKDFYIVYLGERPEKDDGAIGTHMNLLTSVKPSHNDAKKSIVYSYTNSFNAFAAKLSPNEAEKMKEMEQVLGVFPNRYHKLHTTKSWDFIGFPTSAKRHPKMESDVIIGVLDTGITPDSESFKDTGLGPPPSRWKGSCGPFANFSGCNHKLIGAKYFKLDGRKLSSEDVMSPIDMEGHGTHTSSTAAGAQVANASLFGLANGTARGGVPSARVAMYKVCWSNGCSDMDILAAFDSAIQDGVDLISISIGGAIKDYSTDSISLGSFHALRKGILTVASAGNDGPFPQTVTNHAPWILTVAASGTDRALMSRVDLGNGKSMLGSGISAFEPKAKLYPLVSSANVSKDPKDNTAARYCGLDSLDPKKVKGRVVLCRQGAVGVEYSVKTSGGMGAIVGDGMFLDMALIFMAPGTQINSTDADSIDKYIHSTRSPTAVIQRTREVKVPAPFIASFSSRGPHPLSKRVLKPDIAAPGVNILAAYTTKRALTGLPGDTQFSKYSVMSGTSMACPHASGAAAYVKSFHPNWTAAAIKSAIITSAKPMSARVNNEAEFAYGGGQLNPRGAVSPGLVYDMDELSYIQFLCREGYTADALSKLVGSRSVNCSSIVPGLGHDSLNYPTFHLTVKPLSKKPKTAVFMRTVTNVGPAVSVYNATVRAPKGVKITVQPQSLSFTEALQTRSFKVFVKAQSLSPGKMLSAHLIWKSPRHTVRSPIVIYSAL